MQRSDITDVLEKKARAAAAHTSQFGDNLTNYDANKLDEKRAGLAKMLMANPLIKRKNGRVVEQFRRTTAYGG